MRLVTVTPTAFVAQATSEPTSTPLPTRVVKAATPTPVSGAGAGTLRMYLCPLSILIVFSIGVLALSIVLPRIRERQDQPAINALDSLFVRPPPQADTAAEDLLIGVSSPGPNAAMMNALFSGEDEDGEDDGDFDWEASPFIPETDPIPDTDETK
jgi:hypothetical protein